MSLVETLHSIGYNQDIDIKESVFKEELEELHETKLALDFFINKNERSYRDRQPRYSLHLKNLSGREDRQEDFVAELERFNPEFHPILHLLVDFPLWLWKNRMRNLES